MADAGDVVFKWTDEHTKLLIEWRSRSEHLFTGRRNAAIKGYETFLKEFSFEGKVSVAWVKKKWENLKQKYKDLKCLQAATSTGVDEPTATSWKWYEAMDEAVSGRPSVTPPFFIASSGQCAAESSPVSATGEREVEEEQESPVRKKRRDFVLQYLLEVEEREEKREKEEIHLREAEMREDRREKEAREMEERREREVLEREERREREALEREERREREALQREERRERETREREERREREALEREERRERKAIDREERRERETTEREERREREAIEREERRERETREREERFLQILELLIEKCN